MRRGVLTPEDFSKEKEGDRGRGDWNCRGDRDFHYHFGPRTCRVQHGIHRVKNIIACGFPLPFWYLEWVP
jgi:hypothetical protein